MPHTFKLRLFLFSSLALIIVSCGSEKSSTNQVATAHYKAVIVDSVVYNHLSPVRIVDYNEQSHHFLVHDEQSRDMIILDSEGNELSVFNPFIDGPNYMGDSNFGWSFYGEDQLVSYGRNHFFLFSEQGQITQRMEYPVDVVGWSILDYQPQMIQAFEKNGKKEVMAIITGAANTKYRTQFYQDSTKVVYTLDFESGKSGALMRKPETSIYRTLGKYIGSGYPNFAKLQGEDFAVAYELDDNVYIFDAAADKFTRTFEIPETYQPEYTPVEFNSRDQPEPLRVNSRVFALGNHFVLEVWNRIPKAVMDEIENLDQWWESDEYKAAERKYTQQGYLLFDKDKGFLGEINWPLTTDYFNGIGTGDDFMWILRQYEEERDYYTFLKVKIVVDEEG